MTISGRGRMVMGPLDEGPNPADFNKVMRSRGSPSMGRGVSGTSHSQEVLNRCNLRLVRRLKQPDGHLWIVPNPSRLMRNSASKLLGNPPMQPISMASALRASPALESSGKATIK